MQWIGIIFPSWKLGVYLIQRSYTRSSPPRLCREFFDLKDQLELKFGRSVDWVAIHSLKHPALIEAPIHISCS